MLQTKNLGGSAMLQIDIANCYGLDHETWIDRLLWAEWHEHSILGYHSSEQLIKEADEPLLMRKAILAYQAANDGIAIGHNMYMDATASGLQIMSCLSGCKKTAIAVNLIKTGKREDVYLHVANDMNAKLDEFNQVTREDIKKPLMTHYYNSLLQPVVKLGSIVNEDDERYLITDPKTGIHYGMSPRLTAFHSMLKDAFPGAEAVMELLNSCWDNTALEHKWTLPDGFVARVKVKTKKDARIQVAELNNTTFTYRFEINAASDKSTSLVPNVIHSIDAYIVRVMIRRANAEGFELSHIFDCFSCHPNYMGRVLQMYREVLAEIAESNLLADIMSELTGESVSLTKYSDNLASEILQSEYALS